LVKLIKRIRGWCKKNIKIIILIIVLVTLTAIGGLRLKTELTGDPNLGNKLKPSLNPTATPEPLEKFSLSGWIPYWRAKDGVEYVLNNPNIFDQVLLAWYQIDKDFKLSRHNNIGEMPIEKLAAENQVYVTIGSDLKAEEFSKFLNNTERKATFIGDVVDLLNEWNIEGVDIDWETITPGDKEQYLTLLQNLSEGLGDGTKLSVTVYAQTGKSDQYKWAEVYDLKRISGIADQVRVMAYDLHNSVSGPGAISTFEWLREITTYSLKSVDKTKLIIGMPSYGYVWKNGQGQGQGFQYDEFIEYAKENKLSLRGRDSESGEEIYESSDGGTVGYLSGAKAVKEKMDVVRRLGINKFTIWHLGGTDLNLLHPLDEFY
jgi:spore germination protein YaaH